MPAFGADGILTAEQIGSIADYVMSLSKQEHDAASAAAGQQVYADNCASCHGDAGQGGRDFGAPRLDDAIALYAGTKEQVVAQVTKPRHGVMPAWGGRLDEATIKQLAVYVHSLGGGEAAAP
jgi:cytochrome c oxidase cbb3-type subunit 3